MQVLDFKKQIEEKQGADYPACGQKVIFKGSVGLGAMHIPCMACSSTDPSKALQCSHAVATSGHRMFCMMRPAWLTRPDHAAEHALSIAKGAHRRMLR